MIDKKKEYIKFSLVILFIVIASWLLTGSSSFNLMDFMPNFMGAFFLTFAVFKILSLEKFANGFAMYDLLAQKSIIYAYVYPFIQLEFGFLYIFGFESTWLNIVVFTVSIFSSLGVVNSLIKKKHVHCVCLGNVIKLPLSSISFVEDFGMASMALLMLVV